MINIEPGTAHAFLAPNTARPTLCALVFSDGSMCNNPRPNPIHSIREEPQTEAGRALLGTARSRIGTLTTDEIIQLGILAIEAEARAALLDDLAAKVAALPPLGSSFTDEHYRGHEIARAAVLRLIEDAR